MNQKYTPSFFEDFKNKLHEAKSSISSTQVHDCLQQVDKLMKVLDNAAKTNPNNTANTDALKVLENVKDIVEKIIQPEQSNANASKRR